MDSDQQITHSQEIAAYENEILPRIHIGKANYVSFCLPPKTMKEEKLVTRPVRDLDLTINFNMAVLRGAALSAAESEFVDYVVRVMQREG